MGQFTTQSGQNTTPFALRGAEECTSPLVERKGSLLSRLAERE